MKQVTPFPPDGSSVERRTPVRRYADAPGPAQGESAALRETLAALIAHPKMPADVRRFAGEDECDRCTRSLAAADAVLRAGFRRVVEDDVTIERLAKALAAFDGYVWSEDDGAADNVANPDYYLRRARAVVRALREET